MASSSQVKLSYIAESAYGTTPASGNFDVIRFASESLSGTPSFTQSNEIRADRQPTGQVLTGLDVSGTLSGPLAPTKWVTDFLASAMMDEWNAAITTGATDLDITTSGTKLVRTSGSFITDGFAVGDLIQLSGFSTAANNTFVYVSAVSALELTIVGPASLVNENGGGDEVAKRHKFIEIGSDLSSYSISKNFLDLTSKAIAYRGLRVNGFTADIQNRAEASISFDLAGGGGAPYSPGVDITDSRTVNAVATEPALSGSSHVGLIIVDGARVAYCVSGFNLQANNNHSARNCLGSLAPSNQDAGEATVNVSLNAYMTDDNFSFHAAKTNGSTVSVVFPVVNNGEGYAFAIPAFKPNSPDAQSGGKNQQIVLNISGAAEPTSTRNALRVYHITQA